MVNQSAFHSFQVSSFISFGMSLIRLASTKNRKKGECCRGDKGNNKQSTNAESGSVIYALLTYNHAFGEVASIIFV